jgi:hypothetical protein
LPISAHFKEHINIFYDKSFYNNTNIPVYYNNTNIPVYYNNTNIPVYYNNTNIPVFTLSYFCKLFGIAKICTFTWCTLNLVQWLAWWWLYEWKCVATFIIDNILVGFWLKYILSNNPKVCHKMRNSLEWGNVCVCVCVCEIAMQLISYAINK